MKKATITYHERLADSLGIPSSAIWTIRRAALALHRWAEGECGDCNEHCSWCIERDEQTGIPYRVFYPNTGKSYRRRIPDLETGAMRRITGLCKAHGIHWYHQTDPRGASVYLSREPLTEETYTRGHAVFR
jgi:hypothetical protein